MWRGHLDWAAVDETHFRPAARIICLDDDDRVLMMCWTDPVDGHIVWEPPGGGIEPGETPLESARRELAEETGLDPDAIGDEVIDVQRDVWWKGKHFVGSEQFFQARYPGQAPGLDLDGQMDYEQIDFRGYAWVGPGDLADLDGDVEPPHLAAIVAKMAPASVWAVAG
jgi:8-oxo-dGTP pyrophosphatase MutT (NUDIX family)